MKNQALEILKPWCPFCGMDVGRPAYTYERRMREFPMGRCECGAVYVAEATGHNIGAAMVECLVNACGGNADLAWDLLPEDDYLTGQIDDYDEVTHQVVRQRMLDGRAVRGVLFFVRLHKDLAGLAARFAAKTGRGTKANTGADTDATPGDEQATCPPQARDPKRQRLRASKEAVRELVRTGDVESLTELYLDDRRTLHFLQRLLYAPDREACYHVAWVLGQVCSRGATLEPGPVADLLHRLFEACSDSASSSWGMIEGIGAIIANRPDIYGAFTRHLYDYMGDPARREAVLWGLGEIAAQRPDLLRALPFYAFFPLVTHSDPAMRGLSVRLLGRIHAAEASFQIFGLTRDQTRVSIPEQGRIVEYSVAALATEALQSIHQEKQV